MLSFLFILLTIGFTLMASFLLMLLCKVFKWAFKIGFGLVGLLIAGAVGLFLADMTVYIIGYELLFVFIAIFVVFLITGK